MSKPTRYSQIRPQERLPEWLRRPVGTVSSTGRPFKGW